MIGGVGVWKLRLFKIFLPILIVSNSYAEIELLGGDMEFHGTVVSRPCDIATESEDQVVEMRTVVVKMLYRNQHSTPEPFSIKLLNCKTDVFKTVDVIFTGTEDAELPGHLAISGEAAGAGIALFDPSGAAIDLGTPITRSLNEGNNQLNFSAWLVGQPKALEEKDITVGQFTAIANFTLSYL